MGFAKKAARRDKEEAEIVNADAVYDRSSEDNFRAWLKKDLKSE